MTEATTKSPLPDWKYAAEINRFQNEVKLAQDIIDEVNNMSDDQHHAAAEREYKSGRNYYETRLTEIDINGEEYEGEESELRENLSSLRLLSPSEWKSRTLENALTRKSFYQNEMDDVQSNYTPIPSGENVEIFPSKAFH